MSLLPSDVIHMSCSLQGLSSLFDKGKAGDSTECLSISYTEFLSLLHSPFHKTNKTLFLKVWEQWTMKCQKVQRATEEELRIIQIGWTRSFMQKKEGETWLWSKSNLETS